MLSRKSFVGAIALLSTGLMPVIGAEKQKQEEVTPTEDLMREHGALNRMLLIYDTAHDALSHEKVFPRHVIRDTATLVRRFIEDYHERLEEVHLFPRFRKAGKLVDLVEILNSQHSAGKVLTAKILGMTESESAFAANSRSGLIQALYQFNRMYRPHEAREDTVLFPALRSIVSAREYDSLGEQFEDEEHKLFGKSGFENIVTQISELEKAVGIYDLAQFTPPAVSSGIH